MAKDVNSRLIAVLFARAVVIRAGRCFAAKARIFVNQLLSEVSVFNEVKFIR